MTQSLNDTVNMLTDIQRKLVKNSGAPEMTMAQPSSTCSNFDATFTQKLLVQTKEQNCGNLLDSNQAKEAAET